MNHRDYNIIRVNFTDYKTLLYIKIYIPERMKRVLLNLETKNKIKMDLFKL